MSGPLAALWGNVRNSFWFLPTVMALGAVLLAEGAVNVDERVGLNALRSLPWVYGGSADGARSMLGAIAGSVIGVAGTTFSITVAALSLASNQMGPRLLEHFTRDRGNQFALGTFIATFAFCLLVLRTVRGGETPFVPHLAVTLGLALALLSLGVLIYFIAHIASGINVGTVIRLVSDELTGTIERQFPERDGARTAHVLTHASTEPGEAVRSDRSGYLQGVDVAGLIRLAARSGGVIHLTVRPGDFVFPGMTVAHILPRALEGVSDALVIGPRRTSRQDVEFAARQLVEVAVRALSPGINDPFTAIAVLDHLGAALSRVSGRELPPSQFLKDGQVRLVMPVTDYNGLTDMMFHQIRQNGASHPAVMLRLLEVLTAVAGQEHDPGRRESLRRHANLTLRAALRETKEDADRHDLEERYRRFERLLDP